MNTEYGRRVSSPSTGSSDTPSARMGGWKTRIESQVMSGDGNLGRGWGSRLGWSACEGVPSRGSSVGLLCLCAPRFKCLCELKRSSRLGK